MFRTVHTPDISNKIVPVLSSISKSLAVVEEMRIEKFKCSQDLKKSFFWEEMISLEEEKIQVFEEELLDLLETINPVLLLNE